ncbi:hypothetical protein B0G84_3300 [Paraburkholderia sp. BL8N3]|nr:hypothetical protein [Paraburkholderia sp. BL8N3]TCK37998.1 hypothetical protein B0G84_3300 [Paraburkholderia sp. BL8N3]
MNEERATRTLSRRARAWGKAREDSKQGVDLFGWYIDMAVKGRLHGCTETLEQTLRSHNAGQVAPLPLSGDND